jgi:nanoRNase/pAp phosphatase (c-di-AMP/oligoRNAs hydrolase)
MNERGINMKRRNKFDQNDVVILVDTGEKVTINKTCYVAKMKKYTYTIKENPKMFYFEEEMKEIL